MDDASDPDLPPDPLDRVERLLDDAEAAAHPEASLPQVQAQVDDVRRRLAGDAERLLDDTAADRAAAETELAAAREERAAAHAARARAEEELVAAAASLAASTEQAEALLQSARADAERTRAEAQTVLAAAHEARSALDDATAAASAARTALDEERAEQRRLLEATFAEAAALQAELLAELEEDTAARIDAIEARAATLDEREAALDAATAIGPDTSDGGPSADAERDEQEAAGALAAAEVAVAERLADADAEVARRLAAAEAEAARRLADAERTARVKVADADQAAARRLSEAEAEAARRLADADRAATTHLTDAQQVVADLVAHARAEAEAGPPPPPPTSALAPSSDPAKEGRSRRTSRWARGLRVGLLVLGVLLVSQLFRAFVATPYTVASTSMAPQIDDSDRLLVNRLAYRFSDPHRGDVVAIEGDAAESDRTLVKRVIGLPGEEVSASNGEVLVDGEPVDEPWLTDPTTTRSFDPIVVPRDQVFVLGDNRGGSYDSRAFGPIPIDSLLGRVELVYWPPANAGDV